MAKIKIFILVLFSATLCFAQNTNKSVSVRLKGLPPQYSTLRIDTLSRCIVGLPDPSSITASAEGRTEYLKRISGTDRNDYVKVWNANVQLIYQWKFRLNYLIIPQGGLEAQAPVFHEAEGTRPVVEAIAGDPQESDFFAFSSPRRYYFDSQQAAINSAVNRARQRVAELRALECAK